MNMKRRILLWFEIKLNSKTYFIQVIPNFLNKNLLHCGHAAIINILLYKVKIRESQ